MASKNEEVLAGDDIEGILAVIDSDILAEPNDLDIMFAAKASKIQGIILIFIPKLQKNIYNKKRVKSLSFSWTWRLQKELRRETASVYIWTVCDH